MTSKWLQKTEGILGEMPIGAPLVVQTVFVMKKLAPNAPKVRPRTKNGPKYLQKLAKTELKIAPKRASRVKKSFKS